MINLSELASAFQDALNCVSGPHSKADELLFEHLLGLMNEHGHALPREGDNRHWRDRYNIAPAPDAIVIVDGNAASRMAEVEDWMQDTFPEGALTSGVLVLRHAFTVAFKDSFYLYGRNN